VSEASSKKYAGRLIRDGALDGAFNMAADIYLAEEARRTGWIILRLYRWQTPTLSLGFHQKVGSNVLDRCTKMGVPVVRRPTGGRAVLHDNELTYCLVLPESHPLFTNRRDDLLRSIGEVFVSAARRLNLDAELVRVGQNRDFAGNSERKGSPLCFDAVSRWEVRLDGRKWIGSAQRFLPGVLLQHGSILLGESSLDAGELFGLKNAPEYIFGQQIENDKLADSIVEAFSDLQRINWRNRPWSIEEESVVRFRMNDHRVSAAPEVNPAISTG
jgi:lipoate-protein ligase A